MKFYTCLALFGLISLGEESHLSTQALTIKEVTEKKPKKKVIKIKNGVTDNPVDETFHRPYDHPFHDVGNVEKDLTQCELLSKIVKIKDGRKCEMHDWVAVHYRTTIENENRVAEDSRDQEHHESRYKVFQLGHFQVPKAWEIHIQTNLHAGERAKISAPSHFAYGGGFKQGDYEGFGIPKNSDVIFDLDVLDCFPFKSEFDANLTKDDSNLKDEYWGDWDDNEADETSDEEDEQEAKKEAAKKPLDKAVVKKVEEKIKEEEKSCAKEEEDANKEEDDVKRDEKAMKKGKNSVDGDVFMKKQADVVVKKAVVEHDKEKIEQAKTVVKEASKIVKKSSSTTTTTTTITSTSTVTVKVYKSMKKLTKISKLSTKEKIKKQEKIVKKKRATLQKSSCFYIIPVGFPNLYFTASLVDKYPKKNNGKGFGVFNVDLQPLFDVKQDSPKKVNSQKWGYDVKQRAIVSLAHPNKALFEGFNKNLIVYKYRSLKNQKFVYDIKAKVWFNAYTRRGFKVKSDGDSKYNIVTDKFSFRKTSVDQQWTFKECEL